MRCIKMNRLDGMLRRFAWANFEDSDENASQFMEFRRSLCAEWWMRIFAVFFFVFPLLGIHPVHATGEWWGWTMLTFHQDEKSNTALFMGNRYDADDGPYVQIISPRYKRMVMPWLETGYGLSFLSIESLSTGERFTQFRPEFELTPKFRLTDQLQFELRNRMEWRWNEGQEFTWHRSRHRVQLGYRLAEKIGPVTRFFINNEILTDLNKKGELWENRAIPMGVTLASSKQTDLDLFYMIFSVNHPSGWVHESVIGSFLRIRF